jgi:hypothetical protein
VWGDGAVEELRGLLPEGGVLAHQLALAGSVLAVDEEPRGHTVDVTAAAAGAAATHFVAAFGPRAGELAATAAVAQVDQRGQRAWERRRSADLAFYRAIKAERDALIVAKDELYALAKDHIRQLEEFRDYIHELEGRLGLPLSGAVADGASTAAEPGAATGPAV